MMAGCRHRPLILLFLLYAVTVGVLGGHALLLMPPLIWLSLTDLDRQVIPDAATALVAIYGLLQPVLAGAGLDLATLALALLALVVLATVGEAYWRRHGAEALGLGDAKLIGAGILVVGMDRAWLMILLASAGGIVATLLARCSTEDRGIPFGPFLAYAIFVVSSVTGQEVSG